jgi:hypothetical protein
MLVCTFTNAVQRPAEDEKLADMAIFSDIVALPDTVPALENLQSYE